MSSCPWRNNGRSPLLAELLPGTDADDERWLAAQAIRAERTRLQQDSAMELRRRLCRREHHVGAEVVHFARTNGELHAGGALRFICFCRGCGSWWEQAAWKMSGPPAAPETLHPLPWIRREF